MIKNKKTLYLSILLLIVVMILNFPFPHRYPLFETTASILNIPIQTNNGYNIIGIVSIVLVLTALIILSMSLKKYNGRMMVVAIVALHFVPIFLIYMYQSVFAQGVYAISYDSEESTCHFEMIRDQTLSGNCALQFNNHKNKDVQFELEFQENRWYEGDPPMVEMMNNEAPYHITLHAKEAKTVHINTLIDVSTIPNHIENGQANGVHILIRSDEKEREL